MTWASEVGWITGQAGTISGDIAELFVLYDGLNMSVIDLTQRVIVLEGEVVAINGTLAALPDLSGYTTLVADVSDLLTRVGVLEAGFAALPDLSGYPTLLADVAQLKLDVAAIQGTLAGLPDLSGYGALVTEVGSLRDDLTALQGTVAALPDLSGYGALVTQVGDHETRVGALESWRAVDEPEIDQLRIDVDALIASGGGGGGGGGAAVVHLKYPDDFTAVMSPGFGVVDVAEIGPAEGDSAVDVFVIGSVDNATSVILSAKPRLDGADYPVRVTNARASSTIQAGRVFVTTSGTIAGGFKTEATTKNVNPGDYGLFVASTTYGTVTPNDGFVPITTVHTESLFLPVGENNSSDPAGAWVGDALKMIQKRIGRDTWFRVRSAFIEGDTSDQNLSISVAVRRLVTGGMPPVGTNDATIPAGWGAIGPIVAGARAAELPASGTPSGEPGPGWALLYTGGAGLEPSYVLFPSVSYSPDLPVTPASKIHVLVEFGASVDYYRVSNYNSIF